MKRYVFLCFLALLSITHPAGACKYKAQPFDQLVQAAPVIFVGKVSAVENGKAIFSVDASVRGAEEGKSFSTEIGQSSCDIRFVSGQTWLYMGGTVPSGSVLLITETGRLDKDNSSLVKEKLGYDISADASSFNGTYRPDCAPWDGPAFSIRLRSGIIARIYSPIPKTILLAKTYPADMTSSGEGSGSIVYCPPVPSDAKPSCQRLEGGITLTEIRDSTASGYIDVRDGERAGRHEFHVRFVADLEICG